MRVLTLSNADIHAALSPDDCEQAMAGVLAARARGDAFKPLRTVTIPPGAAGFIGLMPAYVSAATPRRRGGPGYAGAAFGLKAICLIPGNPARGLDAHQGTVQLYDGDTGMPTAILNASAITEIRTAAVTAVATRALAREDARVLAMLGAGVQARSHLHRVWPTSGRGTRSASTRPPPRTLEALRDARPDHHRGRLRRARRSRAPTWWSSPPAPSARCSSTPGWRRAPTSTRWARARPPPGRSSPRRWRPPPCSATAANPCVNEAGEFRLAVEEGLIAGEDHIRAELGRGARRRRTRDAPPMTS